MDVISGLTYVGDYLCPDDQIRHLAIIDSQPWLTDLKRRVQHYGYRYDYRRHTVDPARHLGPLPDWARELADRLYDDGFCSLVPDQLIVNEYLPGQGISSHVDCVPCFGDAILSMTLGSPCVMVFRRDRQQVPVLLEPGSLVVLEGEARYVWKHGIPARKTDVIDGRKVVRRRRVSMTFRTVFM